MTVTQATDFRFGVQWAEKRELQLPWSLMAAIDARQREPRLTVTECASSITLGWCVQVWCVQVWVTVPGPAPASAAGCRLLGLTAPLSCSRAGLAPTRAAAAQLGAAHYHQQ